jgi:spoIIIJ-associated protein
MKSQEIRTIIHDLLTKGGFPISDIEERFDSITESTVFNILSLDARVLIGRDGETVKALNHLIRKIVDQSIGDPEAPYPTFSIDVDDYFKKHFEQMRSKVTILANRVRSFSTNQAMPPMNGYERLVVHNLVAEISDITSESAGEGRDRHIVLKYTPETVA